MKMRSSSSAKSVPLGKILVLEGFITNQQLFEALQEQKKSSTTKVGDLLVEMGYITGDQLDAALKKQGQANKTDGIKRPLGEVLIENKYVTKEDLRRALDKQRKNLSMKIGDKLIEMGYLTQSQLETAIQKQGESKKIESIAEAKVAKSDQAKIAPESKPSGKAEKPLAALLKLLIKKKIITKEEFLAELNK